MAATAHLTLVAPDNAPERFHSSMAPATLASERRESPRLLNIDRGNI